MRALLRRRPPSIPRGWHTGPPDFVGVGAQRSGSSWWYRLGVESHPSVVRVDRRMKELHYFGSFWNGRVPADLAERYHRFFPRPDGAITGEWTPRYMFDHWSMRLLHESAPQARILVILRDPIERFRSGFTGPRPPSLGLGGRLDQVAAAVSRSAYAEQLRRVFDFYPREQVLVLQYERCARDPDAEIERTQRFLGVEPVSEPRKDLTEDPRPPRSKPDLPPGVRADVVARLRHDISALAALCPEIDLSLWPDFADLAAAAPARNVAASAP